MLIIFSVSIEDNQYVVRVRGRIVGKCSCEDDPSNPVFWLDTDGECLVDQVGDMGAGSSLAQKLADAYQFSSRL
jgi:hypothetical protein